MALFADAFEDALCPMHDARCGNALAKVWDERARGEAARVVSAVNAVSDGGTAQAAEVARRVRRHAAERRLVDQEVRCSFAVGDGV